MGSPWRVVQKYVLELAENLRVGELSEFTLDGSPINQHEAFSFSRDEKAVISLDKECVVGLAVVVSPHSDGEAGEAVDAWEGVTRARLCHVKRPRIHGVVSRGADVTICSE